VAAHRREEQRIAAQRRRPDREEQESEHETGCGIDYGHQRGCRSSQQAAHDDHPRSTETIARRTHEGLGNSRSELAYRARQADGCQAETRGRVERRNEEPERRARAHRNGHEDGCCRGNCPRIDEFPVHVASVGV
jgi:hypothetical protein